MENLRKMKKNKIFILVVFILLCLSAVIYSSYTITTYVFAGYDENSDYNTVESVFGDSGIKHSEYLYSLDDNSDYVYVSFTDGGYAVLSSAGGDLLERADKDVTGYQKYITAKKILCRTGYVLRERKRKVIRYDYGYGCRNQHWRCGKNFSTNTGYRIIVRSIPEYKNTDRRQSDILCAGL